MNLPSLTAKIRELVPEIQGKCLHFPIDSDKFDSSGKDCIGYPLNLEVCRVALRRAIKSNKNSTYVEIINDALDSADRSLCLDWDDLKPFENQLYAHTTLASYLLKE